MDSTDFMRRAIALPAVERPYRINGVRAALPRQGSVGCEVLDRW